MQRCQVCINENVAEIDKRIVKGADLAKLAREFSTSYSAMYRHAKEHISRQLATGAEIALKNTGVNLMTELGQLMNETREILEEARDKNHNSLALKAIQQIRGNLSLLAAIENEIYKQQQQTTVIEVRDRDEKEDAMIREGLSSLTPEERRIYHELSFKMVCGMGARHEEELPEPPLDPDTSTGSIINPIKVLRSRWTDNGPDQAAEQVVDPEDHSSKPKRTTPRRKDPDIPMRRTKW